MLQSFCDSLCSRSIKSLNGRSLGGMLKILSHICSSRESDADQEGTLHAFSLSPEEVVEIGAQKN
eukprot:74318-Pelagomonas_calceolata.AAC.2